MDDSLKTYLVCATPRSGSTLLCEMLDATGVAGRPLEHFEYLRQSGLPRQPREYFADLDAPEVLERLAPLEPGAPSAEAPEEWWERLRREGATDNGVWGAKIMWGHVEDFVARARQLPGLQDADLQQVVSALLGEPQLIYVTRADKVAQAVSLWRAVQTQAWRHDGDDRRGPAAYDFAAIDHLVGQLEAHERAWREWFARTGRSAVEFSYDEMDQAPQATVGRVLDLLGLRGIEVPDPHLSRQRDERSAAWAERYRREREQAA